MDTPDKPTTQSSHINHTAHQATSTVAALDIGSNSFHLIVARFVNGSLQTLHKVKQSVRLAQGLSNENKLDQAAIDRGLACLSQMTETLTNVPPENIRIVATYTLRKAANSRDFIKQAKKVFPYPIEIIPGKEEARLIYQGIANTVADQGRRLVIDIGGGSTELIIGDNFTPLKLTSRSMGCVSFTNQYFVKGEITNKTFKKAIIAAKQELENYYEDFTQLSWQNCHGTSGTIKAIREAVIQNNWSASNLIDLESLHKLKAQLIEFGHIDKVHISGVTEQRNAVLAGGLAILIGIFELFEIKQLSYEDAALREGVLYEMEDRFHHHDIRERSINSLSALYHIDTEQAARVRSTTEIIFNKIYKSWGLAKQKHYANLLVWAAQLTEVGINIHSSGYHKHSAYIIEFTDIPGFNQEEQNALAVLVRYHRKKLKTPDFDNFTLFQADNLIKLTRILRIAAVLNLRRRDNYLPEFNIKVVDDTIHISFPKSFLEKESLLAADLEGEQVMQNAAEFGFEFS